MLRTFSETRTNWHCSKSKRVEPKVDIVSGLRMVRPGQTTISFANKTVRRFSIQATLSSTGETFPTSYTTSDAVLQRAAVTSSCKNISETAQSLSIELASKGPLLLVEKIFTARLRGSLRLIAIFTALLILHRPALLKLKMTEDSVSFVQAAMSFIQAANVNYHIICQPHNDSPAPHGVRRGRHPTPTRFPSTNRAFLLQQSRPRRDPTRGASHRMQYDLCFDCECEVGDSRSWYLL
ncbi:hypothetical protein C8R43DRAFT_588354 [Mycena crocata]|nr:hypothetical protein C8R43DRAFT_588354 [Mycena crocata]